MKKYRKPHTNIFRKYSSLNMKTISYGTYMICGMSRYMLDIVLASKGIGSIRNRSVRYIHHDPIAQLSSSSNFLLELQQISGFVLVNFWLDVPAWETITRWPITWSRRVVLDFCRSCSEFWKFKIAVPHEKHYDQRKRAYRHKTSITKIAKNKK